MKKTIITVLAVAILGVIGVANAKKPSTTNPMPPQSTMMAQNGSSQTTTPASTSSASNTGSASYKDGTYTGDAAETPYGTVQIAAVISGGKITDINFLQMPNDQGHSREISAYSEPYLKQTAIDKQNANSIDFVTGATSTSYGFQESLQAALNQAANS